MKVFIFAIFIQFSIFLISASSIDDEFYKIGVVEFTPELLTVNWAQRTVLHLENYTRIVSEAASDGVDILVFPEYTLNNVAFPVEIPNPIYKVIPCESQEGFDNLVIDLSCLARDEEIYLCINLNEREDCSEESQQARNDTRPCSSLGFSRYNTNVIFDKTGAVVGRYRKFNLFRESGVNTTLTAELSTFETDFGVAFANIICFDILFFQPAMQLVQKGIKNFIFPALWTSELPFLTSNQIYQSWAYRNDVNVFAAGANMAQATATGSGFFLGRRGNVFDVFDENPQREFYTMKIAKNPRDMRMRDVPDRVENDYRNLRFGRDNVEEFTTELIDFTSSDETTTIAREVCHEETGLCCNFEIEFDEPESDVEVNGNASSSFNYRFVAFNGYRDYSGWGYKKLIICAIIVCNNETVESCGRVPNYELNQINFNLIEITTTFSRFGVLMMPNSLDMNMNPLNVNQFSYEEFPISADEKIATIRLLQPHSDLQSFALYGNDYQVDDEFDFITDDGSGSGDNFDDFLDNFI